VVTIMITMFTGKLQRNMMSRWRSDVKKVIGLIVCRASEVKWTKLKPSENGVMPKANVEAATNTANQIREQRIISWLTETTETLSFIAHAFSTAKTETGFAAMTN